MNKVKQGDIVGRKSYNKDIIFLVKKIKNKDYVLLEGVFERIIVDSKLEDLEKIDKHELKQNILLKENRINSLCKTDRVEMITGKILHLDGDRRYSEKSYRYYKKMGIKAIVKNIPENKQSRYVYGLLKYYRPDILVITGHDGIIRKEDGYYNIYNYRNSKYFMNTVIEARRFEMENNSELVIFAGACQSYFEVLINAGANFASSPERILIDILDPLIIARKVAITDRSKYVRIEDIEKELRDGRRGIDGIGARRNEKRAILKIKVLIAFVILL